MGCASSKSVATTESDLLEEIPDLQKTNIYRFSTRIGMSKFTQKDYNPLTDKPAKLTDNQMQFIRASWKEFTSGQEPLKSAACAFTRFFALTPEVVALFKNLAKTDQSTDFTDELHLLHNAVMRSHMEYFLKQITIFVEKLDNHEFEEDACEVGRKHVEYGAKVKYMPGICEAFLFSIEKTMFPNVCEDSLRAWESFLLLISHQWAKGFHKASVEDSSDSDIASETGKKIPELYLDVHEKLSLTGYPVDVNKRLLKEIKAAEKAAKKGSDQEDVKPNPECCAELANVKPNTECCAELANVKPNPECCAELANVKPNPECCAELANEKTTTVSGDTHGQSNVATGEQKRKRSKKSATCEHEK